MSENRVEPGMRTCEWCAESISAKALKCPRCTKWRKDIDQDRVKCYSWSLGALFPAVLMIAGAKRGWWGYGEFSFGDFFTSLSGLLVIAGFIVTSYLSTIYYVRVSRKIDNWIWF